MKADGPSVISETEYHISSVGTDAFQKDGDSVDIEKLMETVDGIAENAQFFVNLFKRLDPLAAGKRGAKKSLDLKKTIESVFSVLKMK